MFYDWKPAPEEATDSRSDKHIDGLAVVTTDRKSTSEEARQSKIAIVITGLYDR